MRILVEPDMAGYGWVAIDDDTYDGPPSPIGTGRTEDEAYRELLEKLADKGSAEAERLLAELDEETP